MRWLSRLSRVLTFGQAPDPTAREVMQQLLRRRVPLSISEWANLLPPHACNEKVTRFFFEFFESLYGIDMSRSRPTDAIVEDLNFPRSLWSDWELDFAEAFEREYAIDLFESKAFLRARTVGALIGTLASELITSDR